MPVELYCEDCGAGPFKNSGSKRSHKARHCKKRPAGSAPQTIETDGAGNPPASESAAVGQRSAPVFEEPPAPEASAPPSNRGTPSLMTPEEMERRIQSLVEARVQALMSSAEQRLGAMMQQSIGMIEETCNKLPSLVEKQVQGLLGGSEQVVVDESGTPQPQQPPPAARPQAPASPLAGLLSPEILELAAKLLGAEDTSIGSIIAAVMKKSQQSQKKAEPLNASMMTRGAGHMISWMKNKRIDPMALARVTITEADEIMKMPGIDSSTKSYWIGRKGEATNYLAGLKLQEVEGNGGTPKLEASA